MNSVFPALSCRRLELIHCATPSTQDPRSRCCRLNAGWQWPNSCVSSAYWCVLKPYCSAKQTTSAVYKTKRMGPFLATLRTEWSSSQSARLGETYCWRWLRYDMNHASADPLSPNDFCRRPYQMLQRGLAGRVQQCHQSLAQCECQKALEQ